MRHIEHTYEPKLNAVEADIRAHCSETLSILLNRTSGGIYFIEIRGPDYLVPHGVMYFHFNTLPTHLEAFASRGLPYEFSQKDIIESDTISLLIDDVFDDILFQEWHSCIFGTTFLSDSDIYLNVSRSTNDKQTQIRADYLLESLAHNVPVIHNANIIDLLKLRQDENESFQVYRDSLSTILKGVNRLTGSELREMLDDTIRPQLNKIDLALNNWKNSQRRTAKNKIVFGSAAVLTGYILAFYPQP